MDRQTEVSRARSSRTEKIEPDRDGHGPEAWVPSGWDLVLVAKDSAARQLHPDDFAPDLTRILRQLS
jgi:hypothetical protein